MICIPYYDFKVNIEVDYTKEYVRIKFYFRKNHMIF